MENARYSWLDTGWDSFWFQDHHGEELGKEVGEEHNSEEGRSGFLGRIHEEESGNRSDNRMEREVERSVVNTFGTKEGREIQTSSKLERSQHGYQQEECQVRTFEVHNPIHKTRRLDDYIRPERWLSPSIDPSGFMGSFGDTMEEQELCFQSAPVWSGNRSVYFHKSSQGDGKVLENERDKGVLLHRRLHNIQSIEGKTVRGKEISSGYFGKVRMEESGRERNLGTKSDCGTFGVSDKHKVGKIRNFGREVKEVVPDDHCSKELRLGKEEDSIGYCGFDNQCAASFFTSKVYSKSNLPERWHCDGSSERVVGGEGSIDRSNSGKYELVPLFRKSKEWEKFFDRGTSEDIVSGYGLFFSRLWSFFRESNNEGFVEQFYDWSSHWRERVKSGFNGIGEIQGRFRREEIADKNGQQDSSIISIESWWENTLFERNCKEDLEDYFGKKYSIGETLLDKVRRQPIYRWPKQRFGCDRMESILGGIQVDRGKIWENGCGQVRFGLESQMQEIQQCNRGDGMECGGSGRFFTRLEQGHKLRFGTFSTDWEHFEARPRMQSKNYNGNPSMDVSTLVVGVNGDCEGNFDFTFSPNLLWEKQSRGRTFEELEVDVSSGEDRILKEFVVYASGSWAESTKERYLRSWKKYEKWCMEEGAVAFPVQIGTFCKYLWWLIKTAPSEVRLVIEVVKWLEKLNNVKSSVADSLLVKRFADAVERNRKKMKKAVPFPVEILKFHFDNKKDYKSKKAWLQELLIVGLCLRLTFRTETLKMICAKNISFVEQDGKRFAKICVYKSKTNQVGQEKVYWLDSSSNPDYCLVLHLESYLLDYFGKDWEKSDSFLFTNSAGNQISTFFVSKILNKMAKSAGKEEIYSSKSLRVGAVEWMVRKGYSFESISALGWSVNSTALGSYVRVTKMAMEGGSDQMFSN